MGKLLEKFAKGQVTSLIIFSTLYGSSGGRFALFQKEGGECLWCDTLVALCISKHMEIYYIYNTDKGSLLPDDIHLPEKSMFTGQFCVFFTPFCDQFKGPSKHMLFVITSRFPVFISRASPFSRVHKNAFMFSTRETITEADAMAPVHSPGSLMCINRRIISLTMWNVYHHTDAPWSLSPRCNLSGSKTSLLEGKKKPLTRLLSAYRL